jgi:hypothetical protein
MVKQRISIAAIFVVGCVAGGVSARVVAPPARAGSNPPKWEHWCFHADFLEDASKPLVKAGDDGWELVGVTNITHPIGQSELLFCFKRPR